jgi:hypothetical protein
MLLAVTMQYHVPSPLWITEDNYAVVTPGSASDTFSTVRAAAVALLASRYCRRLERYNDAARALCLCVDCRWPRFSDRLTP